MSNENPPYCELYIKAWTALSLLLGAGLLSMFVFGEKLLHVGGIVWAFFRWLASPFI